MTFKARLYAYGEHVNKVNQIGELVQLVDPAVELWTVSHLPIPMGHDTLEPTLLFDLSSSPEAYSAATRIRAIPRPGAAMIREDPDTKKRNILTMLYSKSQYDAELIERVKFAFPASLVHASEGEYPILRGAFIQRKGIVVLGEPESVEKIEGSFDRIGLTTILTEERTLYSRPHVRKTDGKA